MSDSQSLNTSFREVMISFENECIFIPHLNDLTFQIIFEARWDSMNVRSNGTIVCNSSRYATSWRFNSTCGVVETGCPGIMNIVCDQVLCHPLEHGPGSMGKHLLAKIHMAKLNKLT